MSLRKIPISKAKNAYELLNDVCRVVTEEPKRVYMSSFIEAFNDRKKPISCDRVKGPACGTVGCIAGWVTILKRPKTAEKRNDFAPYGGVEDMAIKILGSDLRDVLAVNGINDGYLEYGLFSPELYDTDGNETYPTYGTRAYARAVVRKIRAFQKKHKAALLGKAV